MSKRDSNPLNLAADRKRNWNARAFYHETLSPLAIRAFLRARKWPAAKPRLRIRSISMPVDHDLDRSGCICVPEIWRAQIDGRIRRIPKHFPCISRNREFQAEFHRSTNIFNIRLELTLWLLLVELDSINWLGILETTGEKKEKKRKKMRSSLWKSKRGWRSFAREFRNSWNSTSLAREGCCDRQALHFCHHPASWYLSLVFLPRTIENWSEISLMSFEDDRAIGFIYEKETEREFDSIVITARKTPPLPPPPLCPSTTNTQLLPAYQQAWNLIF